MLRTLGAVVVGIALSVTAWAQTPQASKSVNKPQPAAADTVKNDRLATMPTVGVSATFNPNQNELVGCVINNGNQLALYQEELRRTYQLRGNDAAARDHVGHLVQITGRLVVGTPAAFEVQQVQEIQPKCNYAQTSLWEPATGKTGAEGKALNVTSTSTVGQPTPGVETEAGLQQNPSMKSGTFNRVTIRNGAIIHTASEGAPPDPREENPQEAERIANSATRSELNNQQQLGVNAQPNYTAEANPQQTQQFTANEAQQERGQAAGSAQVLRGGAQGANATLAGQGQESGSAPVFIGCIEQHDNQTVLVESNSGEMFRIDAQGRDLGQFLHHQVRIAGNLTGTYGPAIGTSGNSATVHVESITATGNCGGQ